MPLVERDELDAARFDSDDLVAVVAVRVVDDRRVVVVVMADTMAPICFVRHYATRELSELAGYR